MKAIAGIHLADVQSVYSGPEGRLWELLMGEQIHIGGFRSSTDLADRAGISTGMRGVDLCCCLGGGMRFLLRYRGVARMHGVDATPAVFEEARRRCHAEGFAGRAELVLADACRTGLPSGRFDFVWGEDAWCYVEDKAALIEEAARLAVPGGLIAFTDWIESGPGLTDAQAERFLRFMKFPNVENIEDYRQLLSRNGCTVIAAEDTGRFAPCIDLYLRMIDMQLTGDALRIVGFDFDLMGTLAAEMKFVQELAIQGKIAQGLFVARRDG